MSASHNPRHNPVDLYDSAYGNYAEDVYRQVRLATYGEDLGPTNWVTSEESPAIPQMFQLTPPHPADRVSFEHCDVSKALPFPDAAFDAAFANDVLCHIPERPALLQEAFRVLQPSGRLLFSDALIIGGAVSHQEIATRSSIGYYIFTPPGHNERLIQDAGFHLLAATDTTAHGAA